MIAYDKLFIGGQWVVPSSTAVHELNSASTEEPIGSAPRAREADIDRAVAAARQAFDDPSGWANWESSRRADAIDQLAHQLEIRAEEMARRVSSQNGMPSSISTELEGKWPLILLRYYANPLRESCFGERTTASDGTSNWTFP
jgi:acyl-CoA reductase-like NAD-dependent aldehyde dehydrogenase